MFANPYTEPVLLIVIGLCGAVVCGLLDTWTPAGICLVVAIAGLYEIRATSLHEQDLKKFDR